MTTSFAQDITGLWEVSSVAVGEETMTPVAKWFRFNEDNTYTSGNGWVQNTIGTWKMDRDNQFTATNTYGPADEYGAFDVKVNENEMVWKRSEDGLKVIIYCKQIDKLPVSPTDLFIGLWKPNGEGTGAETGTRTGTDEGNSLFIRWDRIYVNRESDARYTGYWHINGHKPEVTFLPHDEGGTTETWEIDVDDQKLIMIGISKSNEDLTKSFSRSSKF